MLTIGDGYLLRSDQVAVALIELTPPDLRLYDTEALTRLLDMYRQVLQTCPDRCSLATFALPLTITPLIQTLGAAQQRAPDFQSYAILGALTDWLTHAWASLLHVRTVRWIVTVPSVEPETPPAGTWGELLPAALVGQTTRCAGDPVEAAVTRARRLVSQFAGLGMEPPPRLLSADAIRALLRLALDPVAGESHQQGNLAAPRLIQVVQEERGR
ncbi:MAG: hypothetical protein EOM10_07070 [Opitutae bacterium]|nr:hypothetical protein [Opitutae bacterium]